MTDALVLKEWIVVIYSDRNFERKLPLKKIVETVSDIRALICGPNIRLSKFDFARHGYEEPWQTGLGVIGQTDRGDFRFL
ncbi:hypothetical protein G6L32_14875 [Agrobacterium tumefaciens]|uniref:hypothetical protein n=1 Tax=Agrobacterium tumefaciens TaxID=358 RepID=UPI0015737A17|nr:hypothetical protein [Agrobacterium tumefaciens]